MKKVYMAIGAHIGDNVLQAGLTLCELYLKGHEIILVNLTKGERGNPPNVSLLDYEIQKEKELNEFTKLINAKTYILNYKDGLIPDNEEVRVSIANLIRKHKPNAIFTHWKNSMHKDHALTHKIVVDSQFYAGVDTDLNLKENRHFSPIYFAENWEDLEDYEPYIYFNASKEAYQLWKEALKKHHFIMNSTSFDYYEYYTNLAVVRGRMARSKYAESFNVLKHQKRVIKNEF